jgi:hypothetical protein
MGVGLVWMVKIRFCTYSFKCPKWARRVPLILIEPLWGPLVTIGIIYHNEKKNIKNMFTNKDDKKT